MRLSRPLVAILISAAAVVLQQGPAAALDRCAGADPFTPALKADVAARYGGHHVTATAHDTRTGCTWHLNPGMRVTTASVVKVEVGAGVLLRAQRQGRGLTAGEQARLWPMITQSANPPTTELWTSLGGAPGMAQLDRTFGLRETSQASPSWGITSTTARDQVHLLRQVVLGEGGILDAAHRAPLVHAMGSVVPSQRWGVSAGVPPGNVVRLKNGFAGSACCAWRINSVGVVEHVGGPLVLAVLSDGWGSMAQGIPAIESVARAVNNSVARFRSNGLATDAARQGHLAARADGQVVATGGLAHRGDLVGVPLRAPVTGIASTPSGDGYWMVAADGGIFAFGGARFFGSMGGQPLVRPVVGMAATPSGGGYWLVASDGGIFAFGDARFRGSTGGLPLVSPVVGMEATPSGDGYWLAAADGGVFAFNAPFRGSMGGLPLVSSVMAMARSAAGTGYVLLAADGGVFAFNAPFPGSAVGRIGAPAAALAPNAAGSYRVLTQDGATLDL
jgi:hypothetical protein